MKHSITLLFLSLFVFTGLQAQDPPAMRYKNEVGFDMSAYLFHQFPENAQERNLLSLMYKRRIGKSFFRLGVSGTYAGAYSFNGFGTRTSSQLGRVGLRMGYERIIPFWRRFGLNLGFDGYGEVAQRRSMRYDDWDETGVSTVNRSYTAGVEPFAGLEFYFFKRLSLGFESGIRVFYNFSDIITQSTDFVTGTSSVPNVRTQTAIGFSVRPFEVITINIHF